MSTEEKITQHLTTLAPEKSAALSRLYQLILMETSSTGPQFFDGKNEKGKVVTNPTIGFGKSRIHYANGRFQDTFRIGICATSTGLSIYILGLEDKNFLREFLGDRLGKAKITGYAISFKKMSDIDESVLRELVRAVTEQ